MKYLYFSIFIFFQFSLGINASILDEFNLRRISAHYYGTVFNDKSILIYGEAGVITGTNDFGKNWFRTQLNEKYDINSMISLDNEYIGVMNERFIIKSIDNGTSFTYKDLGSQIKLYKILSYENNFYILSDTKILILNKDLERVSELIVDIKSDKPDFIILNDNLYYSKNKGIIGKINLKNKQNIELNLNNLGICTDCPHPSNFEIFENKLFFLLDKRLISYDEKSFNLIINLISSGPITATNSGIYQIYRQPDYFLKIDSVYFISININSKQTKQIKRRVNDRYISNLTFKNLSFINNETVIAVGNDNLIYISTNSGIDWELKSLLKYLKIFRFNKLESATIATNAQFFRSQNGGVTWLPQRNFDPAFTESVQGISYFNYPYVYFHSAMNGFALNDNEFENEVNIAYTKDGGDSVTPKFINSIKGYIKKNGFPISSIPLEDKTILFYPTCLQDWNFTLVFYLDQDIETINRTFIDSTILFYVDKYKEDELIGLAWNLKKNEKYFSMIKSSDTAKTWTEEMRFALSEPDFLYFDISSVILSGENILMSTTYYLRTDSAASNIYRINIRSKVIEKLFHRADNWVVPCFLKSNNKIYFQTYHNDYRDAFHQWFVNPDLENNPWNWIDVSPKERAPIFLAYNNSDSLIYFTGLDLEKRKFSLWFTEPKVETSVEIKNSDLDFVLIDNPIPNPSRNNVKLRIWWDSSFRIDKDFVKIFDLFGNNLTDFCRIQFELISPYSGEISLQTEQLKTGLYFVGLHIDGKYKTKPIFILK